MGLDDDVTASQEDRDRLALDGHRMLEADVAECIE
jgi:hypothetical protein